MLTSGYMLCFHHRRELRIGKGVRGEVLNTAKERSTKLTIEYKCVEKMYKETHSLNQQLLLYIIKYTHMLVIAYRCIMLVIAYRCINQQVGYGNVTWVFICFLFLRFDKQKRCQTLQCTNMLCICQFIYDKQHNTI